MNKFDKTIKQKIKETRIAPSDSLWSKIEAKLDENDNKKALIIPFWATPLFKRAIAASLIFLLGGFSTYVFLNSNKQATSSEQISSTDNENTTKELNKLEYNNDNKLNKNKTTSSNVIKPPIINSSGISSINNKANLKNNTNNKNSHIFTNSSINPPIINNPISSKGSKQGTTSLYSVSNYVWIYDEELNAFNVLLKEDVEKNTIYNDSQIASFSSIDKETTSYMSLENKEENKEEKIEILEMTNEDDSYKQFKTKIKNKLNYNGLWLGPEAGYEAIFVGGKYYTGGSFGIDLGYDFGSVGIQSGIRYSINSKYLNFVNKEGITEKYKSEFNAVHIPLMLRYKFTKLTRMYSKPLSLNLLAGFEYSYVDTKKLNQLGFVVGTEYDLFTQADMMFTFGLKAGIHNNLNLNRIETLEKINRYNYNLNAYLSMRFIDWTKKTR